MRDEYCSFVTESISPLLPASNNRHNHQLRPILNDKTDEIMENLQKLFDTHQKKKEWGQQQPGCSTSSIANERTANNSVSDVPSSSQVNLPLFLPSDDRSAVLKSTLVSDQLLACFVIGGECRLCFPQLRALCLGEVPTQRVDEIMKSLAIVNPLATEGQLCVLKKNHIIPIYLPKCELITKTNAERLIAMLKFYGLPRPTEILNENFRSRLHSINVVHDCFGGCSALLYPSIVPNPCLECRTCHYMFKPEDFCRHTHEPAAGKDMCFWGFDASNWPYYIRIDDVNPSIAGNDFNHMNDDISSEEAETQLANFIQSYSNFVAQQQTIR